MGRILAAAAEALASIAFLRYPASRESPLRRSGTLIAWSLAAIAAGLALLVLGFAVVPNGAAGDENVVASIILGVAGMAGILVGGVLLTIAIPAANGQARLRAGQGVIARWTVPPESWRAFVAAERQRNAVPRERRNALVIRDSIPPEGVEVVVGRTEVMIDGFYESLRQFIAINKLVAFEWVDGSPACLESRLYRGHVQSSPFKASPIHRVLRFPVADDAHEAGRAVLAHFRSGLERQQGGSPPA